jgi:tetratricopeptide (TPR) repeat protein
MPVTHTEPPSLSHAVFLQRAAHASPDSARGLQARLAQGAFLALRLIDLLAPEADPVHPDAFRYQCAATERFFGDLRAPSTEGAHLQALVESAGGAQRKADVRLLVPGLFAYAHYLEEEMRLKEALDVLGTLRRVGGARLSAPDAIALSLRTGRVNRKLSQFDEAEQAYAEAGRVAGSAGDRHSELLSRIGHAHALLGRGNLPQAELSLTKTLTDAQRAGDRAAAALAEHVLAAVLQHRGSPDTGLVHAWRAFELYEDEDSRLRALGDVGLMLLMVGDVKGAEQALGEVVRRGASVDLVANALIELMHCASLQGDRVGFERWRGRCKDTMPSMSPNILADYYLKAGIGEARFGRFQRAVRLMDKALQVAESAGLHEFVFKIERTEALNAPSRADAEPVTQSEAVRGVSASVALLAEQP